MDFFEQWFGWSPDGGDGTTEMFYILFAVVVVAGLAMRAYHRRGRTHREPPKIERPPSPRDLKG
jgi:nitrate/nitrite transporter NarK